MTGFPIESERQNGLSTLVIGDTPLHRLIEASSFLDADAPVTFLAADLVGKMPVDTALRRHIAPSVFVWHSEEGRAAHAALDKLAANLGQSLGSKLALAAGIPNALRFAILDHAIFTWLLAGNIERALMRETFARIVVVTRSKTLFTLVAAIAARLAPDTQVALNWLGVPPKIASPFRAVLPFAGKVFGAASMILRGDFKALSNLFRDTPDIPVETLLPKDFSSQSPAVIGWIARDRNYREGLQRVLRETLPLRPVFLILDADDDEKTQELNALAASVNRPAGHWFYILRYSAVDRMARYDLAPFEAKLHSAAIGFVAELHTDTPALERDFAQIMLPDMVADYAHLRSVCLMGRAMEALLARTEPAYAVLCSARNASFAAVAEMLAARDIPSMDVNTYLVGNHARQVAPPTRYFGVIDDQQEALIMDFWGAKREDILRIGYLWRDAEAAESASRIASQDKKSILICTQPGEPAMVEAFFADVLDVIAGDTRMHAVLKPHPAEAASTLAAYDAAIVVRGLEARVKRLEIATSVSSLFADADLVITRTSNVGIEAALAGKPIIRYIAYDRYNPGVISDVVYAANVLSKAELANVVRDLLTSSEAIAALTRLQDDYRRENPAQALADGASRIIAFLEARTGGESRA